MNDVSRIGAAVQRGLGAVWAPKTGIVAAFGAHSCSRWALTGHAGPRQGRRPPFPQCPNRTGTLQDARTERSCSLQRLMNSLRGTTPSIRAMHLERISLIVDDYDTAIEFFVDRLGFELVQDEPALTTKEGRPKRWVMVRPPGAQTGLLLAQADGEEQQQAIGEQFAGRVGLFLRV